MISLDTELTVERLLRLASPRVGPLTQLRSPSTWPGVNHNFLAEADMCDASVMGGQPLGSSTVGFGQGARPPQAMIRALAEGLERYGAGFLPEGTAQQKATYEEISRQHHVWPLEDLQILRPQQEGTGKFRRLEATDSIDWVRGQEWTPAGAREIWHPACFLSLNHKFTTKYDMGTTSGFAVGPCFESAALPALCEVIERDCFASTWWRKISSHPVFQPKDVWHLLPTHLQQILRPADADLFYLVDMTAKWGVPTFMCVFLGKGEDSRVIVSSSSNLDPRKAMLHCLAECTRILDFHRRIHARLIKHTPKPPYEKSVVSFYHHVAFGTSAEAMQSHQFLIQGPRQVPADLMKPIELPEKASERLNLLIQKIHDKGSQAALFNFTPIDLRREGFSLVRAKIRHAIPIESAYAAKPLGCPALRDIPLSELNINPHCFP